MKKLFILCIFASTTALGQGFQTPEIQYGKYAVSSDQPEWVQWMYSETPDPGKVTRAYNAYYQTHPFKKNTHTQYYKRWMRSFSRDNSRALNDPQRIQQLQQLDEQYWSRSAALANSEAPNSEWQGIGPIDFDKEANGVSYAAGAAHFYSIKQSLTHDSILYAGTATAGVWKSVNKGASWQLVTRELLINSVAAVEIDPTNSDVAYFSANGALYKTIDGGTSWSTIGGATFATEEHYIPEIKIDPNDQTKLFVCSDKGFFRSTDAGTTLTEIMDGDFQEMEFHPTNSDVIYTIRQAGDSTEFHRSADGGLSFAQVTTGWPAPAAGEEQKRTEIATTPADPSRIYALSTGVANGGSGLYGVYVSTDAGASWARTCCGPQPGGAPSLSNQNLMAWADDGTDDGGQYYYDLALEVSDQNADVVYVAGVNLWKSTDGGSSFVCPSKWSHSYKVNYVHADIHDIQSFGNEMWIACDGGAFYTDNEGDTIARKMYGVEGTDFWGFGTGFWDGEVMLGGTYHNGTLLKDNDVYINGWISTAGGDNIRGFVNQGDDRIVYHDNGKRILPGDRTQTIQSGSYANLPNASYIFGESSNIAFHPQHHETSYVGKGGRIWVTHEDGNSFSLVYDFGATTVTSIEVAWADPNTIYACTYDGWWDGKHIWRTRDGGVSWTHITPPDGILGGNTWLPYDITISGDDANTIWMARTSMYDGYPSMDGMQVYKSTDGGDTWTNYSTSTLDGEYLTNIVHQRGTDGGVYVGTRRAVYYRNNTMNDWQLFNNNLPVSTTSVQLIPYYREGKIRNGTNRSAYECDFYEPSEPRGQLAFEFLFDSLCPRQSIQFYDRSAINETGAQWFWEFEGGTPDTSSARNPLIYYANYGTYDVTLTVTDTFGTHTTVWADQIKLKDCFGEAPVDTIPDAKAEMLEKKLDAYPTTLAAGDPITIVNPAMESLVIKVFDAKGRMVFYTLFQNEGELTLPALSSGVYILNVEGETKMVNKRVVVNN